MCVMYTHTNVYIVSTIRDYIYYDTSPPRSSFTKYTFDDLHITRRIHCLEITYDKCSFDLLFRVYLNFKATRTKYKRLTDFRDQMQ